MLATIFVSRPTILTPEQEALYEQWRDGLAAFDFLAVTLPRTRPVASPWYELRQAIGQADGAVILGFRQLVVESGCFRPGTAEQASAVGWYASAWNQIEAGLAAMAGLPVLVVPQGDIHEGVFSADVWQGGLYGTEMDVWTAGDGAHDRSLQIWSAAVSRRAETMDERRTTSVPRGPAGPDALP